MSRRIVVCDDCTIGVQPVESGGNSVGKLLVIEDEADRTVYRVPLVENDAKRIGQALMGIGDVQIIRDNGSATDIMNALEKRAKKGR